MRGRIEITPVNASYFLASVAIAAMAMIPACEKKNDPAPVVVVTPPPASHQVAVTPPPPPSREVAVMPPPAPPPPAPDNTATNKADNTGKTKTPLDQSQSAGDIRITAEIRRAIVDDKTMSVNAQNCKIITDTQGMVTLRGVVDSQAEKDSIETKAKQIAGASHVDNQLEVKMN